MAQHQQYNYTSNFQGQELDDAQLRLNVDGESFDYQPSGPDVEIDIDADLVIDGTVTFEEFRTEYFAKDRPVWLKTGGMYQMLVPFLGVDPDGYYEFAKISADGSSVMWWHLSQDGWTHGTTRIEQTTTFDVADLPDATDPMSNKAFKIATCKLPENVGEFTQCELFLQISLLTNRALAHHDTFKFRIGANKYGADSYDRLVECLYGLHGDGGLDAYLEKLCLSINDGYLNLVIVQKTGVTLSHLVVTAAIINNIGPSKTPWYLTKGIMDRTDVSSGGFQYYFYSDGYLETTQNKYSSQFGSLNTSRYPSSAALGSFIPIRTYGVSRTYTEGVGNKYAVIATYKDTGNSAVFASHFCVQVATTSGDTDGKQTCGTFHIFISGVGGYARNIRGWWESVTTDSELSGTAPKSMHLVKDGSDYSLVIEFTDTLNGGATSDVAFITVLQNATKESDLYGHMRITNGGWVIPITSWAESAGSTQRVNTTASLPAGTDTEYLFANGTSLHSINQNGIVAGEDVSAPFMYKVSTPTFNYPGRQGFFGLALADGKSYIAKITLTGQTDTKAVVVAIDTTANDVRLRYASGDVGIVDYTDNDDPDDTNYLKFFKSDDGDGHYYLTIKCGYVNAYETCTATVELVCFDYSQNSVPIGTGASLSTGTWPSYAQNRTQKFAAIAVDGPLDQSIAAAGTSTTTAPSTKAVYDYAKDINATLINSSNNLDDCIPSVQGQEKWYKWLFGDSPVGANAVIPGVPDFSGIMQSVCTYNGIYGKQIVYRVGSTVVYSRYCYNGTWTSWEVEYVPNHQGTQTFTDSDTGYRQIALISGPVTNGTDVFVDFEIECYSVPFVPTVIRIATDTHKDGGGTYYFKYSQATIIQGSADGSVTLYSNQDGRMIVAVNSTAHYCRYVCKLLRAADYAGTDLSSTITLYTTQQQLWPSPPGGWTVVTPT